MVSDTFLTARATLADTDAIAPLFDAYRQFYNQPSDPERAREFLSARLEAEESVLYLCRARRNSSAVVGFTHLFPLFSSISMTRAWLLNDLYVMPAFRRMGVARLLLAAAREHAFNSGATKLELATHETNTTAQTLYTSIGYVEASRFKHYSLELHRRG